MAALCEEFESHQDGSGEPEILTGQSIVLGEIKAEVPLQNEDSMNDQIIWQRYIQQVESLTLENKVSKFRKEARFMRVVEVGQYFVTKDISQFQSVACREYTLPRDGQGDGVPKARLEQAAADSRVSRTCVCANPFGRGVAHAGGGRMN